MTLKGKSVLVTGGAGFIGSHLVDRIIREEPSNLVVVDNLCMGKMSNLQEAKRNFPELRVVRMCASNEDAMECLIDSEEIEVVFNLAVISLPASLVKPSWTYRHNVDITLCACELARRGCYKTLIHFSSSEAYGTCLYDPMDEQHPLNPTTPYGASKAATDHLVLSYCKTFGIDASIVRPFNSYGPRQNEGQYAAVIPLTVARIRRGEAPVICGDGEQTRDFTYVTETAEAAIDIYNCPDTRGRVINVGSGKETSINTLVGLVSLYMGCNKPAIHIGERLGDVERLIADTKPARDLIGFEPKITLEEGLRMTVGGQI